MSIIKILPETLVNQIAAGEVIERPASVLKELVENSIDAGADKISIEIKDGGKGFIKVFDNGCGMSREDLEMSLQRHATSKVTEEADLWKIATMGFRGEALASIASVSKVVIKSKMASELSGNEISCSGGDIQSIKEVGMSDGTQLEVFELFFNTPARQKYLKNDQVELSHITATLNNIALANPNISFKLTHNGKVVVDLPKVTDLISRISDIFGKTTSEAMIPIFYGGSGFQLEGFIGKPVLSRSSSKHQYFFVNSRPIQHFLLANTIKSAYHSMLMENKKPVFVINIKIDPAMVDVNVHPRKLEVRFEDQHNLIRITYSCIKAALEKTNLAPKGFTESRRYMSDGVGKDESGISTGSRGVQSFGGFPSSRAVNDVMKFSEGFLANRETGELRQDNQINSRNESTIKAIAQVANSYIIAQDLEGLVLIDQHAAHERVRYEELMDQFENQKKSAQPLLVPQEIELSSDEKTIIEENLNVFKDLGFEIEPFSGNSFAVYAVPTFLTREGVDEILKGVLDDILEEKSPSKLQGRTEDIINYMSCRSAIKFGQTLSLSEMQALIDQMDTLKRPYTCPHGRPTMVSLTLGELHKMFGRK